MDSSLGFIGAGNMAEALAKGVLAAKLRAPEISLCQPGSVSYTGWQRAS